MTTIFGAAEAKSRSPSKRAATPSAATRPTNALRENTLEVHARGDAERARLIRQERNARAVSALDVQRQERALVGHVVDEEGHVPLSAQHAQAQIDEVVGRQQRIERERVLRVRSADVAGERGDVDRDRKSVV